MDTVVEKLAVLPKADLLWNDEVIFDAAATLK